jgi:hypothetical protein
LFWRLWQENFNRDRQQFTNINKTNNHLSLQTIEYKKTKTYDVGNPGPGNTCINKIKAFKTYFPTIFNRY